MKAIVFTSNSGFTAQYAKILGQKLNLPVLPLKKASASIPAGSEILFMGWVMASQINGLKKATRHFTVKGVCAVGMTHPAEHPEQNIRTQAHLCDSVPLFYLQGGMDTAHLHGIYKWIMKMFSKGMIQKLEAEPSLTAPQADSLDLLKNNGSRVSEDQLEPVLLWLSDNGQAPSPALE